jgi:RNA polymerase sigma-70 factor (ECF subfamily)
MVLNGNSRETVSRETIAACQQGDHEAFRTLFNTYQDRVYSIALRYTGDSSQAMDIAQDTFLKLLSAIRQFRAESSFETWLYRLVVNCCIDHYRRRKPWQPLADTLRSVGETVLHRAERKERRDHVAAAVRRLPEEQRMVVVLRYTEGLSYEEIAEIMGISEGTVASRLNRAHKVLERRLGHLRGSE